MSHDYGSDWPAGSVIKMYDETLRIVSNHGTYGAVEYLDGEPVSSQYYWEFQGDRAKLIESPSSGAGAL